MQRAALRCVFLVAGTAMLPGCYAALAGALAAVFVSGDGESSPSVTLIGVEPARSPPSRVQYTVRGAAVNVVMEYRSGETAGSLPMGHVSPRDDPYQFSWDFSVLQLDGRRPVDVKLRAEGQEGGPLVTVPLGNDKPGLRLPPGAIREGPLSGTVDVALNVLDSTEDQVSIVCEVIVEGGEPQPASPVRGYPPDCALPCPALTNVKAIPESIEPKAPAVDPQAVFFWDTPKDLPGVRRRVRLRFTPFDGLERGDPIDTEELDIDNNAAPEVQLLGEVLGGDRSFEIPIHFSLRDAENQPARVVLQWSEPGVGFTPVPASVLEDPDALEALLEDPTERAHFRILSSRPPSFEGRAKPLSRYEAPAAPGAFRDPALVRAGLFHALPAETGPRSIHNTKSESEELDAAAEGRAVPFLIQKEVVFSPPDGPRARITAFDPASSVATIDEPLGIIPPGTLYSVILEEKGLLETSSQGIVHRFIWDSEKDLLRAGLPLDGLYEIHAVAADSEAGTYFQKEIAIASEHLVRGDGLPGSTAGAVIPLGGRMELVLAIFADEGDGVHVVSRNIRARVPDPQALTGIRIAGEDVIAAACGDEKVRFLALRGDELVRLDPTLDFQGMKAPLQILGGDLNGDLIDDLALTTTANKLLVFFASGPGGDVDEILDNFTLPRVFPVESDPFALASGDLSPSQGPELVVASSGLGGGTPVIRIVDPRIEPADPGFIVMDFGMDGGVPGGIAVEDVDLDGIADLVMTDRRNREATILRQGSPGNFEPLRRLRTEQQPRNVVIADFDGDMARDAVVLCANWLLLFLGIDQEKVDASESSLLSSQRIPLAFGSKGLLAGDVNQDGYLDVVLTNPGDSSVFLQSPRGELARAALAILPTGLRTPLVALGDLDADGRPDIAVFDDSPPTGSGVDEVLLHFATLTGAYRETHDAVLTTGVQDEASLTSMVLGDLDSDGLLDILLTRRSATGHDGAFVFSQDTGNPGTFKAPLPFDTGPFAEAGAIGDIDGDGMNDVVIADRGGTDGGASITIAHPGSASPMSVLDPGPEQQPSAVALSDIDGDARTDIVLANKGSNSLSFFLASGGLQAHSREIEKPLFVQHADVNRDGASELAVLHTFGVTLLGLAPGTRELEVLQPTLTIAGNDTNSGIALADVNGDALLDLIAVGNVPQVFLYYQNRQGLFGACGEFCKESLLYPLATFANAVASDDLNGDGRADLVIGGNLGNVQVILGR